MHTKCHLIYHYLSPTLLRPSLFNSQSPPPQLHKPAPNTYKKKLRRENTSQRQSCPRQSRTSVKRALRPPPKTTDHRPHSSKQAPIPTIPHDAPTEHESRAPTAAFATQQRQMQRRK
ncbi:hypothetical protein P280DRAFT_21735 [Massarina eburnea CBS 473.64]|uniref:Uncharacterized protein n=1 Tax=Massarina eburnea CBS 473.64 TaxID=1395130 RepID=A0A6A6SKM4_9PLEO|nr:hypothetical protein P280DRAFT_21735 [Massarina eburnea CBS 473.64]